MNEQMDFPNTFDEFAKHHQIVDKDEHYSNGIEYIPVFRVKQWLEHDNKLRRIETDTAYECGKHANKALDQEPCDTDTCKVVKAYMNEWDKPNNSYAIKIEELVAENDDLRDQLAMRDRFKQEPCDDATLKDIFCMGCEYKEQEPKTEQFAKWVAEEIFDEENWEYNKDAFAEIACRKLAKLGIVRAKGDEWELIDPQERRDKE